jgi:hypothetical protein
MDARNERGEGELVPITPYTLTEETCAFCGAKRGEPCVGSTNARVHFVRLVSERKVVDLKDSGWTFESMDPKAGTITLTGYGERSIWGPPIGRSYALRFMGREFEFQKSILLTADKKKARSKKCS